MRDVIEKWPWLKFVMQMYIRQKRNAPHRIYDLSGRSKVMDQFRLYRCKGVSVTASLHIFLNQGSNVKKRSDHKPRGGQIVMSHTKSVL